MSDTQYTLDPVCPWCGHILRDAQEICPGKTEWDEVVQCDFCGRTYCCSQTVQTYYCTSKPKVDH